MEVPDAVGLPAGKRWIRWDDQESSEASFEAVKDPVARATTRAWRDECGR